MPRIYPFIARLTGLGRLRPLQERVLRGLTPFQREFWLEGGTSALAVGIFMTALAGVVLATSSEKVNALNLALWVPPVSTTLGLIATIKFRDWECVIHTRPIPRQEKQEALWWMHVIAIPCIYSLFANAAYLLASCAAGTTWPWYRILELPVFYIAIHATMFLNVAMTRRFDNGCLAAVAGWCALPFVFNAYTLTPNTPIYYPVICVAAVALSYIWRTQLFGFGFDGFYRTTTSDPVLLLEADRKEESETLDDFVADQANAVAWGNPHPFRAQIYFRVKSVLWKTTAFCAALAGFCWIADIRFAESVFPSAVAVLGCGISASTSASFSRYRLRTALRALPISQQFLTRFVIAKSLAVFVASFVAFLPWLWFAWEQKPAWIFAALLYGLGLSVSMLCLIAVFGDQNKIHVADDVRERRANNWMKLFIGAALIPFISRYLFLLVAPLIFIVGITILTLVTRRYRLL